MNIGQPLRDLGAVESQSLREAILALEEPVWQEEQLRQKKDDVNGWVSEGEWEVLS